MLILPPACAQPCAPAGGALLPHIACLVCGGPVAAEVLNEVCAVPRFVSPGHDPVAQGGSQGLQSKRQIAVTPLAKATALSKLQRA